MQLKWRDSVASPSIWPNASLPPAAVQREHQQMGALALDEMVDPDAVDRCEWHGVSCPLSRTTPAAQGRTPSSGEAAKIITCLCTATLPRQTPDARLDHER